MGYGPPRFVLHINPRGLRGAMLVVGEEAGNFNDENENLVCLLKLIHETFTLPSLAGVHGMVAVIDNSVTSETRVL